MSGYPTLLRFAGSSLGRARAIAAALLLGCPALAGCGSIGLSLGELPTDPIAVSWWEPEDARQRAELIAAQQQRLPPTQQKIGVARVEAIGELLGGRGASRASQRFPGRLSFVDPQSGRVTPVHAIPRGALPLDWSGDRQRLLFLSNHRRGIQVYEYSRESDEVRTITAGPSVHLYASYGLGGQIGYIEVVQQKDRAFERVWVTDADGGSARVVFEDRRAQTIELSPDGKTLLYVRRLPQAPGREPRSELMAIDLASGAERRLGAGREPAFSPIGDWIVYSAPSRAGWRLRRMRADGSARSPTIAGIRDEKMPAVSPDGQFVAYVREATGLERLFVRRLDGSGDRILLDNGAVFAPVW